MFTIDPEYPLSPDEVLHPPMKFRIGVLKAARKLKASGPWKGTDKQRVAKFKVFVEDICKAYGIDPPVLDTTEDHAHERSDRSYYVPMTRTIHLFGRSVISLWHELAHHLFGPSEFRACRWSLNLFKQVFREEFQRLRFVGHIARRQ